MRPVAVRLPPGAWGTPELMPPAGGGFHSNERGGKAEGQQDLPFPQI